MPERIMPGLGLRAFYDRGQRDWGESLSEDLRRLSALAQPRALSRTTALPATGAPGAIYVVPEGAPANAHALALWDGAPGAETWVHLAPEPGWEVWIADEGVRLRFDGAAWVLVPRPGVVAIRTLAVTAYTLALADTGSIVETTGASAVSVTIPPDAAVPFEIGALINVTQIGSGAATIAAAAGVSLNGVAGGSVALAAQWAGVALCKRNADAWTVQGALAGPVA
ncbi:MAG: DUF2793 domain-containing protein [Rubrimonas sp.]